MLDFYGMKLVKPKHHSTKLAISQSGLSDSKSTPLKVEERTDESERITEDMSIDNDCEPDLDRYTCDPSVYTGEIERADHWRQRFSHLNRYIV